MYNNINDNSLQIFYRNNETVMRGDKNNSQMNNQSNDNLEEKNNF